LYRKYVGNVKTLSINPNPELKRFIKRYFFYEVNRMISDIPWNPVTNGDVELFIHFDDSYLTLLQDGRSIHLSCFIKGIYELDHKVWVVPQPNNAGVCKGVAISFTISGLQLFRDITGSDLFNKSFDLSCLLKVSFQSLLDDTRNKSFKEIARILDVKFMKYFKKAFRFQLNYFDTILSYSTDLRGPLHVNALACKCNVSYRSLHRYFYQQMGISPKYYLKVLRFNRMCRYLQYSDKIDWMEIVWLCGYYDQSHFIHEFTDVVKMCPSELLKRAGRKFYLNMAFLFE